MKIRVRVFVSGRVQGVFFREETRCRAKEDNVVENLGTESHVFFGVDAPTVGVATHRVVDDSGPAIVEGTSTVFIARLGPDAQVQPGSTLTLVVDPERLYLFDADTGISLLA